jgi:hypothetical protein
MRKYSAIFTILLFISLLGGIAFIGQVAPVSAQSFGTSPWTSQFYTFSDPSNPAGSSTAIPGANPTFSALNFNWGAGAPPVPGVPADNFRAIFQSTQTLTAGTYTFTVSADDRARLLINNVEVINVTTPGQTLSVQYVVSGGSVFMTVEYTEVSLTAYLQVQWSVGGTGTGDLGPTLTPTIVPTPTVTALPAIPPGALTATVLRANVLNVRNAPSLGGIKLGEILRGETYAVVGRDDDARWFLLQLHGGQAWAWGYYLYVNGNEFNAPVVSGNAVINMAGFQDTGVRVQVMATMRLREGPSVATAQIGRIPWGTFIPVVGRTSGGAWYQVIWWDTVGWVYSPFLKIVDGSIWNVPVR